MGLRHDFLCIATDDSLDPLRIFVDFDKNSLAAALAIFFAHGKNRLQNQLVVERNNESATCVKTF